MSNHALLVIDVQKYYINENTKDLPRMIENFIKQNKFDFVLFTKFINNKNSNMYRVFQWDHMMNPADTGLCDNLIQFVQNDNVFTKDTYSAFKSEPFRYFLKINNIGELTLCGFDTDACVLATAYEGFDLGYKIHVIDDLTSSHSGGDFRKFGLGIINKNLQKVESNN